MQLGPGVHADQHHLSHRLMLAAGLVAATGFALVSIAANLRFGISLANTPFDRAIYGTLSVAADLMKIVLPLAAMILWRKGERLFAIAGAVFWIGAMAFSLSAAIGFAASTRGHTVASNENLIESRRAWEAKIIRVENRLDGLGTPRPVNVIKAEIDELLRMPGAEGCNALNGPVTREICPKVDRLRRELAASKAAAILEADLVADRQAISAIPETASVADPQSAALSRMMGIGPALLTDAITALIAVLVELGSALGFSIILLAARSPAPKPPAIPLGQFETASSAKLETTAPPRGINNLTETPSDAVTRWAISRLDIISSGMIQAEHAYEDFASWCRREGKQPLTPQMFGRRFTVVHAHMGGKKIKRRGRAYYSGVSLQPDIRASAIARSLSTAGR